MADRLLPPGYQVFDGNGDPLSGALLYAYESGTSTPQDTYSDADGLVANTNPVVADSAGRFGPVFGGAAAYKLILKDAAGATLWTADPVSAAAGASAASQADVDARTSSTKYVSPSTIAGGTGLQGASIASASALTLPTVGDCFVVNGTTGIASLSTRTAGRRVLLRFAGAVTLTHSTALDLGGSDITTVANDALEFVSEGSGNWRRVMGGNTFNQPQTVINATSASWKVTSGTVTARLVADSTGAFVGGTSAHSTFLQAQGLTVATLFNGMTIGTPTGGDKGAGTLNVPTYYKNGTAISGMVEGTPLTLNPYAITSTASQAHGLSAKPHGVNVVLECLTAELGYTVGDQVPMPEVGFFVSSSGGVAYSFIMDATSLVIRTSSSLLPQIMNKSTNATAAITAANWKMVATPYKVV